MIPFPCPNCEHVLQIPEQYVGQRGTCKHCGRIFVVDLNPPPESPPVSPTAAEDYERAKALAEAKARQDAQKKRQNFKVAGIVALVAVVLGPCLLVKAFNSGDDENKPTSQRVTTPEARRESRPAETPKPATPNRDAVRQTPRPREVPSQATPRQTPKPREAQRQAEPRPTRKDPIVNQQGEVYITDTGTKYHRQNCRTLKNSAEIVGCSVADAQALGLAPCKVCNPPR